MTYHTIGISGQSASGKTFFLKMLMSLLNSNKYSYIDLDGYHFHGREERIKLNEFPEDINANNIKKVIHHIREIKYGETIKIPTYNHKNGDFDLFKEVKPKPLIFVEGLHTSMLNQIAGERIIDFTFYIKPNADLQKTWKVHRDVLERGYGFETVMNELKGRKPFEIKYIHPQIETSDVIIKVEKINNLINNLLLLIQTNKLSTKSGFDDFFKLKEHFEFNNNYFQLTKGKKYRKLLHELDQSNILNPKIKLGENIKANSTKDIVEISLGLVLLLKSNKNE